MKPLVLKRVLPYWQYITYPQSPETLVQEVRELCQLGCPWLQLRMKNVPENIVLETAKMVRSICKSTKTLFIVNDHVPIAKLIDADGVHLGKADMNVLDARQILGNNKVIGGTANTIEDIRNLVQQGVDYIGLGPFAFTKTKEHLSPILGLEGYRKIITQIRQEGIFVPIYAVGGITLSDISAIFDIGIDGIALSGLLHRAEDPKMVIDHLQKIKKHV